MEQLLQYVWKHKMLPLSDLATTDGRDVEVIDPGLHNRNSGPDFFNAKLRIGNTMWVGNVEIHEHSKDWFRHGHDSDPAYDNVVLHVVEDVDCDVTNSRGEFIPQIKLSVPMTVTLNYKELLTADAYPPCYRLVPFFFGLFPLSYRQSDMHWNTPPSGIRNTFSGLYQY